MHSPRSSFLALLLLQGTIFVYSVVEANDLITMEDCTLGLMYLADRKLLLRWVAPLL